jgi:hypothetical protein
MLVLTSGNMIFWDFAMYSLWVDCISDAKCYGIVNEKWEMMLCCYLIIVVPMILDFVICYHGFMCYSYSCYWSLNQEWKW